MTPSRTGGDTGNLEINRTFKNVGLIRMSLGTSSPRKFHQRVALIEKLHRQERYELLRRLADKKDKSVTIESLLEADNEERLGAIASDFPLNENLWDAAERLLPKLGKGLETRKRYAVTFRSLQVKAAKHLGPKARVRNLADVPWEELRDEWDGSASDWMHVKRGVSKFLSVLLRDKYHPFARKFRSDFPGRKVRPKKVSLTLKQFDSIMSHAPEHARVSYWALVITGMRVRSEYLRTKPEDLDHFRHTIQVPGTKTEGSADVMSIDERLWPAIVSAIPSPLKYKWLRIHWVRSCEKAEVKGVTLHGLRHVAGQWAREGGADEAAVQDFYRHESPAMTRDYLRLGTTLTVSSAIADKVHGKPHGGKRTKPVKRRA